jgi:hypothetical protein
MAGGARSFLEGGVAVLAFFRISLDLPMAGITVVCPCFDQLKIMVTGVFVMAYETSSLCKGLMHRSPHHVVEHPLMAVETDLLFGQDQSLAVGRGVGVMAHHTLADSDGGVDIHTIKKHFLLFMTAVTLGNLRQLQLKLIVGRMRLVADDTVSFLNRIVNIGTHERAFLVTSEAEGLARIFQIIRTVCGMGVMTGRATPLLDGLVDMGLFEQCLRVLVTGIAECAVRHEGLVRVIRGMGAVAGKATAFLNRTVDIGLFKGRLTFRVATVTELRPLLFNL